MTQTPDQYIRATLTGATLQRDTGRHVWNKYGRYFVKNQENRSEFSVSFDNRIYDLDGVTELDGGSVENGTVEMITSGGFLVENDITTKFPTSFAPLHEIGRFGVACAYRYDSDLTFYVGNGIYTLFNVGSVYIYEQVNGQWSYLQEIQSPFYLANPANPPNGPYKNCWFNYFSQGGTLWWSCSAGEGFGISLHYMDDGTLLIGSQARWAAMSYPATEVDVGRIYKYTRGGPGTNYTLDSYTQNPTGIDGWGVYLKGYRKQIFTWATDENNSVLGWVYSYSSGSPVLVATINRPTNLNGIVVEPARVSVSGTGTAITMVAIGFPTYTKDAAGGNTLTDAGAVFVWESGDSFTTPTIITAPIRKANTKFGEVSCISAANGGMLFVSGPTTVSTPITKNLTVNGEYAICFTKVSGTWGYVHTTDLEGVSEFTVADNHLNGILARTTEPSDINGYDPGDYGGNLYSIKRDLSGDVFISAMDGTSGVLADSGLMTNGVIGSDTGFQLGQSFTLSRDGQTMIALTKNWCLEYYSVGNYYRHKDTNLFGGTAFVFRKDVNGDFQLQPDETFQQYPNKAIRSTRASVWGDGGMSLYGNTLMVGDANNEVDVNGALLNGPRDLGAQYGGILVYEMSLGVWGLEQIITHPNLPTGIKFGGYPLTVEGVVMLTGGRENTEEALSFKYSGGTWVYADTVTPYDGAGYFGRATAMHQGKVAVGAPYQDYDFDSLNYLVNAGAVYTYTINEIDGTMTLVDKITARTRVANAYFGTKVLLHGNTLVIGHPDDDFDVNDQFFLDRSGSVEIHGNSYGVWGFVAKVVEDTRVAGNRFGSNFALWTGRVVIANDANSALKCMVQKGVLWEDCLSNEEPDGTDTPDLEGADGVLLVGDPAYNTDDGQIKAYDIADSGQTINYGAMLMFTG